MVRFRADPVDEGESLGSGRLARWPRGAIRKRSRSPPKNDDTNDTVVRIEKKARLAPSSAEDGLLRQSTDGPDSRSQLVPAEGTDQEGDLSVAPTIGVMSRVEAPLSCSAVESSVDRPFYPVNSSRPRPFLSFEQFEHDPEIMESLQRINVPILEDAVWRPNSDGWLGGGFSYVEKARWNKQDVAVKFLRSSQTITGTSRGKKSFLKELAAWRDLVHPNILPLLGVVHVENKYLGMVSPYMSNGSAPQYIARNEGINVLQILYDVAEGMRYLADRENPIAHGDLKGTNVLIDQEGRACICDFGLSRIMKDLMSIDTTFGGTTRWMAPEQLRSDTMIVSLSADIFSWGMLALELISGSIPWPEVQQDPAVALRVAGGQRPGKPRCKTRQSQSQTECSCLACDDALWELIKQCWLDNPQERPTVIQLCDKLKRNPNISMSRYGVGVNHAPAST